MYCPENVSLFGTHTAVTDHRCCGSIELVTFAAVGILTEIFGNSPLAMLYVPTYRRKDTEIDCCDIDYRQ